MYSMYVCMYVCIKLEKEFVDHSFNTYIFNICIIHT